MQRRGTSVRELWCRLPACIFFLATLWITSAFCGDAQRASAAVVPNQKPGSILCEFFKGIDGGSLNDLVNKPAFPNSPSENMLLSSFEIPSDTDDNYGTVVRGFLVPPTTGNYTFWIASDDNSELWLSPSENPKEKIKLCQVNGFCAPREWEKSPEQKSKPIPLTAGRKYYVEALHKEGAGGDNLAVGWQLPEKAFERPIPGKRLIPAAPAKPQPPVVVQIQGQLPRTTGFHKCMSKVSGAGEPFNFPFLLYVPKQFGQEPVPSLLFLHGVGECGTDLEGTYWNGPSGHIKNDAKLREFMPFLVISPQCAPGWSWTQQRIIKATVALMDEIQRGYGQYMDKDRVTMTGLSMGGAGVWHVALEAPDKFAAIVPSDPRAVRPDEAAEKLKDIAVWVIAGAVDGDFTKGAQEMVEALKNNLVKPTLMLVPNCGHGAWGYYYPKKQFYEWLLKWKRGVNVALGKTAPPVAVKKPDEVAMKQQPVKPPAKPVENPPEKPKEVAVEKGPEKPKEVAVAKERETPPAKDLPLINKDVVAAKENKAPEKSPSLPATEPTKSWAPTEKLVAPKPNDSARVAEVAKPQDPSPKFVSIEAKVAELKKPEPLKEPAPVKPQPAVAVAQAIKSSVLIVTETKLPEKVQFSPGVPVTNVSAPPRIEPERTIVIAPKQEAAATPVRRAGFPYAQTGLLLATIFMGLAVYFLLTTEDTVPAVRVPMRTKPTRVTRA